MRELKETKTQAAKEQWERDLENILIDWEVKANPLMGAVRVRARYERLHGFITNLLNTQ